MNGWSLAGARQFRPGIAASGESEHKESFLNIRKALKSSPGNQGAPAVAAALFGISILSGTSYAAMAEAFRRSGVSVSIEGEGGCYGCCA